MLHPMSALHPLQHRHETSTLGAAPQRGLLSGSDQTAASLAKPFFTVNVYGALATSPQARLPLGCVRAFEALVRRTDRGSTISHSHRPDSLRREADVRAGTCRTAVFDHIAQAFVSGLFEFEEGQN